MDSKDTFENTIHNSSRTLPMIISHLIVIRLAIGYWCAFNILFMWVSGSFFYCALRPLLMFSAISTLQGRCLIA